MVASTRVQTLTEGSEYFKMLAEFLKNPNLIKELSDEVKKLNQLSEEEESKLSEARVAIQQRESAKLEAEQYKGLLAKQKEEHDGYLASSKADFDEHVSAENEKLADREASVAKRETDASDLELRLEQRAAGLKEKAAIINGLIKD